LLNPLYTAVSWVLLRWHQAFSAIGLNPNAGLTWALSILMLVVTVRVLLFRFFIKQVHSQRKMQQMQPKIQALREKYKNDRQTLSQEMMKLQREEGFNPLGGCLPVLMQAPVFISLFHVLRIIGTPKASALYEQYHWTEAEATSAGKATLFGAPIATSFKDTNHLVDQIPSASLVATHVVTFVLIVLMCAATFITQRQIMKTSGQVLEGQQAMIQKLMLYGMPISLFFSGFFFPLGVLIYWFTNNLWTMGQQFYILHRHPHPNAVKKDEKQAVDPKLLAPRPGQKPVNPKARRSATPPATPSTAPQAKTDLPAKASPSAAKANPPAKTAPRGPAEPTGSDGGSVDGKAPAQPPSGPPSGGLDGTPRPTRRPPGQRSPTTTRPKKKRR